MPGKKLPLIISSGWFTVCGLCLHAGRMQRDRFLLTQLLSTSMDGTRYLETDSITALEQVTMNIMKA